MMRELEITESEKIKIQSLVENDDDNQKIRWNPRYQQEILSMLLMDKVFLTQAIGLIKPNYFVDQAHILICGIVFDYFNKYKQLPPRFTVLNEIRERRKNDQKLFYHIGELENLYNGYVAGLESRDHCLDKITEFAKEQAMREAVLKTLDIIDRQDEGKWDKVREIFKKALAVDRSHDLGLNYFESMDERFTRIINATADRGVFSSGLEEIDHLLGSGGMARGEIAAYMGLPGSGKSNLLVKAAVKNLCRGHKVLYVSLEMDEDKLAKRFDAQIGGLDIKSLNQSFLKLNGYRDISTNLLESIQEYEDKRRLLIKQFPAGTANVDTLRGYMAHLTLDGFKPDLLLVDYVGEMKDIEGIKTYESRQRLVRDLRGFGVEEQHCTITAMQPNRRGREQQDEGVIDDDTLGDSFGQARPLDALWSINMRGDERAQNVGRIFVVKHRDGESRKTIPFKQDPKTLAVTCISEDTYHMIMKNHAEKKTGETDAHIKEFKPNGGKR